MSTTDNQPAMLLAEAAKLLSIDLTRIIRHHIPGTRDLREIRRLLSEPLERLKKEYTEFGYFKDPETWEWSIRKRGDELTIAARVMPGKISRTQFIFGVPLPAIN